jgi:mannose-P-dolichol utilization defect protein 1
MTKLLSRICSPLVSEECCDALLVQFDFANRPCISLFASKAVGFVLIGFSAVLKLPQLLQIVVHKSGRGVSISSLVLEILANVLSIAYHRHNRFPFSTFGEAFFILAQNLLIGFFLIRFARERRFLESSAFVVLALGFLFAVERGAVTDAAMAWVWRFCLLLSIVSKFPQIWETYRAGAKGELSPITSLMTLLGSLARVFTTLREIPNMAVLAMYLLNMLLNGIIFVQSLVYPKDRARTED